MVRTKTPHTPPVGSGNNLDGCIIAFVSNTTHLEYAELSNVDIKTLKSNIEDCGGENSGVPECTHLIASQEQYERNGKCEI